MVSEFEHFVRKNTLFNRKHKLLLAISGGKDSVCLFHLLLKSGYHFAVAHCNFKLRGAESDQDEAFVTQLCKKHKITCHSIQFDTKKAAKTLKKGTQETARTLRYNWFSELLAQHGYHKLLTAHHLSDNTETMLINLLRSTGISGLHGIQFNSKNICRPLMFTNRQGVDAFIKKHRIAYREDSSNLSDDYLRNTIRHHVTPELMAIDPSADQAFFKSSQEIAEFEQLSNHLLQEKWALYCVAKDDTFTISDDIFTFPENVRKSILYYSLRQYGFSRTQTDTLSKALKVQTGFSLQSDLWEILRERGTFMLRPRVTSEKISEKITKKTKKLVLKRLTIEFQNIDKNSVNFGQSNCLFLDAGKITYPLRLRNWTSGDKIQTLGMRGRKKVSDILTDRKIPHANRAEQLVLEDASGNLVALLPQIVSETCKLDAQTGPVLCIHLNPTTFVNPITKIQ